MTLQEVAKQCKPGLKFKRTDPRVFVFDDGTPEKKKAARLVCTLAGDAAAMFSDDLAADDWELAL